MPTFTTIDGVSRELTGWPVMIGGVSRELDSMMAAADGVSREIFSGETSWKKYAVRTYFGDYDTSSSITKSSNALKNDCRAYLEDYVESGLLSSSSIGDYSVGSYFKHPIDGSGADYYCYRKTSTTVYGYEIVSYNVQPYGDALETVFSRDKTTYPENGLHTDGYWYVKIS